MNRRAFIDRAVFVNGVKKAKEFVDSASALD